MNFNQPLLQKRKAKNAFGFSTCNVKHVMGPPLRPLSKTKNRHKSNSSTSSKTPWGKSCHSVLNSSTLRSGSTTLSSEVESRIILGLTEGRGEARCEVGLASIDLSLPSLLLCQISDSQSYINTLTKINILNPTDILVPTTFLDNNNRLVNKIRKKFPDIKILGIPRKSFNKSTGMDRILQLALPSVNTICVGLQHKYYALAAASALTTYLQHNLNIYYAKESINVCYQESEGYAVIDVSTADRLELVSSTKPAQASRYSTLFGVLNYCVTKVGSRLLRSTILQPPSSPTIIENNLQCVSELIKHPEILLSVQSILQKISNIDQLLTLTSMNLGTTDGCSVRQLNYLLLINSLTDLIAPLIDVLARLQQPFFKEMTKTLESEHFETIKNKLRTMIHPTAHFAKSEAGVTERCFAIKSGVNGLLDLVRKTYSERLNDLTLYVKHLANKYNLPLTLGNNNTKGYHIVLKLQNQQKRSFKKTDLPPEFIQVFRLTGSCTMKTAELINYSTRLEDIMVEILKISNSMIYNLIVEMRQYLGFFYRLCEDIARLDTLQSLAEASKRGYYTRPKFADFTELTNSRHPILEMLIGEQRVANPISICPDFNVQIITGPNGSGKSIYIRQVMLLQIMAQVGCYVPADSAIFRPMNRMFARIYLEDDLECGASSFILEMKEIKYMMTLITENSLFIIDELCRSTAAGEGAALAMAMCEKFCATGVFLYVTTHYTSLANLRNLYLNVKTWHMETEASGDTPQELSLDFKFRLISGVTNLKHYGVYIVKKIWPQSILEEVYDIFRSYKRNSVEKKYAGFHEGIRLKYKLESDFRKLKNLGKLTIANINKLFNDYQNELQKIDTECEQDVWHNDSENQNSGESRDRDLETSSYRDMSNFLREDSDNINKLIPEVIIGSSERQLHLEQNDHFEDQVEDEPETHESNFENEQATNPENGEAQIGNLETERNCNYGNEDTGNGANSVLTTWGADNMSSAEIQSVIDEFESASKSLLDDDDEEFEFSITSSYQTATEDVSPQRNQIAKETPRRRDDQDGSHQHIFPVVEVIEGPQWSEDSSESIDSRIRNRGGRVVEDPTWSQNSPESVDARIRNRSEEMSGRVVENLTWSQNSPGSVDSRIRNRGGRVVEEPTWSQNSPESVDARIRNRSEETSGRDVENPTWCQNSPGSVDSRIRNRGRAVEDPTWSQNSPESVDSRGEASRSESISYSPICSQSSLTEETENPQLLEQGKSHSSSLQFLPKGDDTRISDNVATSDTNLENASRLRDADNLSVDNLKSLSDNKPSSGDQNAKTSSSSSVKESGSKETPPKRRPKKFIPPRRLTRREIQEEFDQQDRKFYQSDLSESDMSKFIQRRFNRPSVRQVQESQHLAFVRKTDGGVEVIPAAPKPVRKKFPFKRNLSNSSNVDVTIFSDKNARCLDEFLNSEERDVKKFRFNFEARSDERQEFNFQPQSISEYAANVESGPFLFKSNASEQFPSQVYLTPDGFYKQNKEDIDNIMNKYLERDVLVSQCSQNADNQMSIFETCSEVDLDL